MDAYHWLPHEIAKIPYKKLQKIFLIKGQKNRTMNQKERAAQKGQSVVSYKTGPGGTPIKSVTSRVM